MSVYMEAPKFFINGPLFGPDQSNIKQNYLKLKLQIDNIKLTMPKTVVPNLFRLVVPSHRPVVPVTTFIYLMRFSLLHLCQLRDLLMAPLGPKTGLKQYLVKNKINKCIFLLK